MSLRRYNITLFYRYTLMKIPNEGHEGTSSGLKKLGGVLALTSALVMSYGALYEAVGAQAKYPKQEKCASLKDNKEKQLQCLEEQKRVLPYIFGKQMTDNFVMTKPVYKKYLQELATDFGITDLQMFLDMYISPAEIDKIKARRAFIDENLLMGKTKFGLEKYYVGEKAVYGKTYPWLVQSLDAKPNMAEKSRAEFLSKYWYILSGYADYIEEKKNMKGLW